ncbi:MAG TPA: dTMP kinase [Acidobacteriota bacterium]|nr:dTMP kinase [Acidobacteriota bacterium]
MLVALEGIDGCGKSTQARLLTAALIERGLAAATFREPGDTEYGRELRRIFVEGRDVSPREEMRLFLEDRRIDVRSNILPALAAGKVVIMDRYYLSSVVYQGALGVDPVEILAANEAIAPPPDLTLLLDIPADVARQRIRAARGATNTFEERDYLDGVRARYLSYCDGESIVRIDATAAPEAVHEELLRLVVDRIQPRGSSAGGE